MGGVRCANCPDIVYANERVEAVGKVFHRLCFKCASCRRLLDRGTACDHKREIFCQSEYLVAEFRFPLVRRCDLGGSPSGDVDLIDVNLSRFGLPPIATMI